MLTIYRAINRHGSHATKLVLFAALLTVAILATVMLAQAAPPLLLGNQFPLYVADGGAGTNTGQIAKLTQAGKQSVFVPNGPNTRHPDALAFDSKGNLYVADYESSTIIKINSDAKQSVFTSGSKILYPIALAFDSHGDLYVASQGDPSAKPVIPSSIVKVDSKGSQSVFITGTTGPTGNGIVYPAAMAFDSLGNLYVACAIDGGIDKVTSAGIKTEFAPGGKLLKNPVALAFDSSGNLYAADFGTSTIVKMTSAGATSVFTAGNLIQRPVGLAFDGDGNLYVVSDHSIVKVSKTGVQSMFITNPGFAPTGLAFYRGENQQ